MITPVLGMYYGFKFDGKEVIAKCVSISTNHGYVLLDSLDAFNVVAIKDLYEVEQP